MSYLLSDSCPLNQTAFSCQNMSIKKGSLQGTAKYAAIFRTVDKCRQSTKGLVKIEGEDRTMNCPGNVRLKHVLKNGSFPYTCAGLA